MLRPQTRNRSRTRPAHGRRRKGMVAVQVAFCLIPLCGVAAFAIDGGMMMEYRRRVQATADAAALAAAADLYARSATNNGADVGGSAAASAALTATSNGFSANSTLTVHIPPITGPFTGKAGYAEVILAYQMNRGFSSIFGSGSLAIQARSVARGLSSSPVGGIILLDPTGSGAFSQTGNGSVNLSNASLVIDSSSATAATLTGNATLTAPKVEIVGGYSAGAGSIIGTVVTGATPLADPLAFLSPPNPSTLPIVSSSLYKISGNGVTTLNPGVYQGGISISGGGTVILNPGIYYLEGGGISASGTGSLIGNGVMLYNAPSSSGDVIKITGNGTTTITPPTSGPYKGISIFQDRTSTAQISIAGGGATDITGTFYAPAATMKVTGNSVSNLGSQYIVSDLTVAGNATVNVVWTAANTAYIRSFGLVE